MTEVNSKKPLIQAIQNGENVVKITAPKFLLACVVAEECENQASNVRKFLDLISAARMDRYARDNAYYKNGIIDENGKLTWMTINLSICANAVGVINLLNDNGVRLQAERDVNGNLTGAVEILR